MASESTPMLPTAATQAPASSRRRRQLLLGAGLVAIVTVLVISLAGSGSVSDGVDKIHSIVTGDDAPAFTPTVTFPADDNGRRDLLKYCEEKTITQYLNQFEVNGGGSFEQRYFVCGQQFFNAENGTIFFYNGNEADVLLYLNNTGLMWENAEEFNALLVFAEHRYFGKSVPFGDKVLDHLQYLSSAQALADFAVLINTLKDELQADVPVIGFGGSYGGMLGTWLRLKYPQVVDGVIAGSAPVLHFVNDPDHPVDSEAYMRIVTFDMSEEAGSSPNCIPNVRKASETITKLGKTEEGRKTIASALRLCDSAPLDTEDDIVNIIGAALGAYGTLAMGNYPYPTAYMTSGEVNLPAYPVRAACEHLAPDFGNDDAALLNALRESYGLFYNATGKETCYFAAADPSDSNQTLAEDIKGNFWGYIECSELYMPMGTDGVHDVFPAQPANATQDSANCEAAWGVPLRPNWAVTQYGGLKAIRASSNIVFSNGNYDPWSGTGVLEDVSDSVVYLPIEGGAHHLDLFFSHPMDPPSVTKARETEKKHIRKWIKEFYADKAKRTASQ
ncbi:hypothetical protein Poli38472_003515 [Pythium oligandrum]|uniref:Lysosomal Pro-X carboxypeptidase n=1 Tax=Pythium oligandrum TaxID=41045 RepID=A0A8K1C781_PYTOL|nr:hypothetical protein Poli38472_003515 [Pythium oligandrum]|eukprot:TMW57590.1 hypothetical protein Poli38472_003515 [Pythium oligandrum]